MQIETVQINNAKISSEVNQNKKNHIETGQGTAPRWPAA